MIDMAYDPGAAGTATGPSSCPDIFNIPGSGAGGGPVGINEAGNS